MKKAFELIEINGMALKNRFVRSATWEGMAADTGAVTPKLIETLSTLAAGGVGLVIPGHTYICPEGKAMPSQLGIYGDDLVAGLKALTEAVHKKGGKIIAQLAHAGNFTSEAMTGLTPVVVSDFPGVAKEPRNELTQADIQALVGTFAKAAQRAKQAGFDGVQLHSAHSYLLSQFLSPVFNHREDAYGGSLENRARVHLEICQAIREAGGKGFPILMKINGSDGIPNGLTLEDSVQVAKWMADAGLDAVEVSGGPMPLIPNIDAEDKEAYFRSQAKAFKDSLDIPVILVGGVRTLAVAEQILQDGVADLISMARPFIREPKLIQRWQKGDEAKAKCISCNGCMQMARGGNGISCAVEMKKD